MPPRKTRKNVHHWHETRIRPLQPALSPIEEVALEINNDGPVLLVEPGAGPALPAQRAPMAVLSAPVASAPSGAGVSSAFSVVKKPGSIGSSAFSAFKKPNSKGGRRRRATKKMTERNRRK